MVIQRLMVSGEGRSELGGRGGGERVYLPDPPTYKHCSILMSPPLEVASPSIAGRHEYNTSVNMQVAGGIDHGTHVQTDLH